MTNIPYVVGVMLLLAGVGNVLGGVIEDAQWDAGSVVFENCESMEEGFWKEQCKTVTEEYEKAKFRNQAIGTIIPLVVGALFIKKIWD